MRKDHLLHLVIGLVFVAITTPSQAKIAFDEGRGQLLADFRLRVETDWDSQTAAGVMRADRKRLRIRLRVGGGYALTEVLSAGGRLRSGANNNQQTAHITVGDFDGNATGDADFNFDKWFLKAESGPAWAWLGRNTLPIWKQNTLFWDSEVTPVGIAAGFEHQVSQTQLALNSGFFLLPVGLQNFSGNLMMGQLVAKHAYDALTLTAAAGGFRIDADPNDADVPKLLTGNGGRNYQIWVGNLQAAFKVKQLPIRLGLDLMHNSKHYSATAADAFTRANRKQRDGYALSAQLGDLAKKNNWLARYTYAHIEALAVNSSYAQDEWARWGGGGQSRLTNFAGHEFRFGYALSENVNIIARLYLVEAITTIEDGKRFRIDLNLRV